MRLNTDLGDMVKHLSTSSRQDLCLVLDGPVVSGAVVAGTNVVWTDERSKRTANGSLAAILEDKQARKRRRIVAVVERCPLSTERLPLRDSGQIFPTMSAPTLSVYPIDSESALVCGLEQEHLKNLYQVLGRDAVIVPSVSLPRGDGLWLQVGWSGATLVSVVGGKTVAARYLQASGVPSDLLALERAVGTDALHQALSKSLASENIGAPLITGFCAALAQGVSMSYAGWSRDGRVERKEVHLTGAGATLSGLTNALGAEGFSVRHPSARIGSLPLAESAKWQDVVAAAQVTDSNIGFPMPLVERRDRSEVMRKAALPVGIVAVLCAIVIGPVVAGSVTVSSAKGAEQSAQGKLASLTPELTLYNQVATLKKIEPGVRATQAQIPALMATLTRTLPPGSAIVASTWTNNSGPVTVVLSVTMPNLMPYREVANWHSTLENLKGVAGVTMGGFAASSGLITTSATIVFDKGAT